MGYLSTTMVLNNSFTVLNSPPMFLLFIPSPTLYPSSLATTDPLKKIYLFIYLFAPGLSCAGRLLICDSRAPQLQQVGSLVAAPGLLQLQLTGSLDAACGILSCGRQAPQLQLTSSLVVARGILSCGIRTLSCGRHVGPSSLTRDRTQTPCIGSMESYPLCLQ